MDLNNASKSDILIHQHAHDLAITFLKDELLQSGEYTNNDFPSLKKDDIISNYEQLYSIFEEELRLSSSHF